MGINQFQAPASPIDAISKALGVAGSIYGIKRAAAASDLINQQLEESKQKMGQEKTAFDLTNENNKALNDPTSPLSQLARADQVAKVQAAADKGYLDKGKAKGIIDLIQGTPAVDDGENVTPAVPGMSAMALKGAIPEDSGLSKFITGEQGAAAKRAGFDFRDNQLQDRQDFQAHQRNLAKLKGDPQLSKRLAQYQNLGNALSNFQNADVSNPQAIDELQQGIRQNLGIGGGGVGEREHTYINSLGLNADRFQQFLTGDPVAISKNAPLAQHLKQLVALESQNIGHQMDKRISALTAGNKSVYDRNPEYKADLLDAVNATKDQYSPGQQDSAPAAAAPAIPGGAPAAPSNNGLSELQNAALNELQKRKSSATVKR